MQDAIAQSLESDDLDDDETAVEQYDSEGPAIPIHGDNESCTASHLQHPSDPCVSLPLPHIPSAVSAATSRLPMIQCTARLLARNEVRSSFGV